MPDWDDKTSLEDRTFTFFMKGMKALWALFYDEKRTMIIVLCLTAVLQVLSLLYTFGFKVIFDSMALIGKDTKAIQTIGITIALLAFLRISNLIFQHFVKEKIFLKSLIKLENLWPVLAQRKLLALTLGYHERENTGRKIAKITKGCDKIIDILTQVVWGLAPHMFYLVFNVFFILAIDWKIGLLFLIPFVPAVMITYSTYKRFAHDWERWERMKESSLGLFCQSIINVQTVQAFVQEKREEQTLETVRNEMRVLDTFITCEQQKYFFWIGMILNISFIATIAFGVYWVHLGLSTVGTMVFIIATGNVTFQSLREIINIYMRILRNLIAVIRMQNLLDEEVDIKNAEHPSIPEMYSGVLRFEDVSFRYPKKDGDTIDHFTMTIEPRRMTAFVGRSGEGKTTIIRLLCRVYDVSAGRITLDGYDIRTLDLFWYRRLFAIVQQDVEIFDATLAENVAYGYPDASKDQIQKALRAARLDVMLDDTERFPAGTETNVGERGIRLSGGERQRVGIARAYLALLHGAKVLVLDEATSSLDSEAERAIQAMLDRLRAETNISIVVIAHRLSTIRKADTILVIDDRMIVEQGRHDQLIAQNGIYADFVRHQTLSTKRRNIPHELPLNE